MGIREEKNTADGTFSTWKLKVKINMTADGYNSTLVCGDERGKITAYYNYFTHESGKMRADDTYSTAEYGMKVGKIAADGTYSK